MEEVGARLRPLPHGTTSEARPTVRGDAAGRATTDPTLEPADLLEVSEQHGRQALVLEEGGGPRTDPDALAGV
jgi:hypothetical protein